MPVPVNPKLSSELTHSEKMKILKETILGVDSSDDRPEAKAWREQCEKDCEASRKQGVIPEMPWDAADPD